MIELENWVNIGSVENAHRRACQEQEKPHSQFGEIGWRAAQARDPKLLKVLEIASNLMVQLEEDQRKETRRTSQIFAETRMTTETQLWIEAYKTVDEHRPIENLKWIYGAGAKLAGFQL